MRLLFLLILLFSTFNFVNAKNSSFEKNKISINDSAFKFNRQLIKVLKLKDIDSLEIIFSNFTTTKIEQNRLSEGHAILNKIISEKTFSDTLKILAYKNKAVLYGQIDLTKKRDAFISAIELINENHCLPHLLPIYQLEIAKTYLSQSNFLDATNTLNKLNIARIQNPEKKVEVLGVCGLLYAQMDDTIRAVNKLNEAISIASKNKDYFGLGTIHSSLANIYSTNYNQPKIAIKHFRISMNSFHKAGYHHYALGSQTDIGIMFSKLKMQDSALYYLQKSYDESIKIGSKYDQSICAKELGILYNKLGEPEKALKFCKEARDIIWNYTSDKFRYTCASCLSKAFEALNESDSSLYYYKIYHAYRDSTLNKDETKAIAKFNAELEKQVYVAEQEKANLEKDLVLKNRNLYIIFLSIFALLIIGIFLLILRGVKNKKKRELVEQQEKNQREFSKGLLQSLEDERKRVSMELHDSVGQLLVVAGRNVSNKQFEQVEPVLQNALNEVRTISQGLHPYVLEKMGLEDALLNLIHSVDNSHNIFIESEVNLSHNQWSKEQEIHIFRIVQELISNCLKHAQSPSLVVEIQSDSTQIRIFVSDKGKGFEMDEIKTKKAVSLGMKTLYERVEILNGTMNIDSKPKQGTSITILIPFKQ